MLRRQGHHQLPRALETRVDSPLAQKASISSRFSRPDPRQRARLVEAEVRDREVVRVIDRLPTIPALRPLPP